MTLNQNKKLFDELIKQLIEIGRSETIPSTSNSIYLRDGWWQRTRYPKEEDCDNFSYEELKSLYKGVVLCEKEFEWKVGSATNAAWILRKLEEVLEHTKDYKEIKKLYDFGFANRGKNDYVPTGTGIHHECATYGDFLIVNSDKAKVAAKHDERQLREQAVRKERLAMEKELKEIKMKERAERKKERETKK